MDETPDKKAEEQQTAPVSAPQATTHWGELEDVRLFLKEHGLTILVGAVVAVAVVTSVSLRKTHKTKNIERASQLLFSARSLKDLESVVSRYPETPYAPIALMRVAKGHFDTENYDLASAKYDEFKQKFPKHELVDACTLGKAFCMEAKGLSQEALTEFKRFADTQPKHYLASQAIFGQARCLEQLGKDREARAIYEDFVTTHPESGWNDKAELAIMEINKRLGEERKAGGKDAAADAAIQKKAAKDQPLAGF